MKSDKSTVVVNINRAIALKIKHAFHRNYSLYGIGQGFSNSCHLSKIKIKPSVTVQHEHPIG